MAQKTRDELKAIWVSGATMSPSLFDDVWDSFFNKLTDGSSLQNELVSGTNIKTINSTSLLGSGDIEISGGGGGNATVENFMYSFNAGVDNFDFFDDGNARFGWDAPGNDLEFYMDTQPAGATDIRVLATLDYGNQVSTSVTQTGYKYDIYSTGVSVGSQLNVIISAEEDATYPMYIVDLYNTGTFLTIKITKTTIN